MRSSQSLAKFSDDGRVEMVIKSSKLSCSFIQAIKLDWHTKTVYICFETQVSILGTDTANFSF